MDSSGERGGSSAQRGCGTRASGSWQKGRAGDNCLKGDQALRAPPARSIPGSAGCFLTMLGAGLEGCSPALLLLSIPGKTFPVSSQPGEAPCVGKRIWNSKTKAIPSVL